MKTKTSTTKSKLLPKPRTPLSCDHCKCSRRDFLASCAMGIGAAGALSSLLAPRILAAGDTPASSGARMKIRVVFALHSPVQSKPDWPNIGFDFNPVMEKIMTALKIGCPGIEFAQSMIDTPENADILKVSDEAAGGIDGYIIIQMNCWNRVVQQLITTGKPVLYADFPYGGSGGFLVYTARLLNDNAPNFAHMSSGKTSHLVAAANCLPLAKGPGGLKAFADAVTRIRHDITAGVKIDPSCAGDRPDILPTAGLLKELKTKKILEYEGGRVDTRKQTKAALGIEIIRRPFSELNEHWENADKKQAALIAARWKRDAAGVIDVSDETLESSARMYLAQKQCMEKHGACAITIHCLRAFYGGHIHAYPCLGFHELLNEGLIGACECDILSTVTMVVMTTMTKGRPGFISDPVMDVARRQIIYAHCVASNKPFGPGGAKNPYTIMTHSEDRKGASVRSTLPPGYMTTTLKMNPNTKEIIFHQARAVGNSTDDRACRTKLLGAPVGDFEKLFTKWDTWGWHRVTYYGDLKTPVFALAAALDWKVIEEA